MSLHKNTEKGKCPFRNLKRCDSECAFYRKGMRYWENENKTEPFEECAINIIADSVENQVQRTFAIQKEMGETKQAAIFQGLMLMGDTRGANELMRLAKKVFKLPKADKTKLPEGTNP